MSDSIEEPGTVTITSRCARLYAAHVDAPDSWIAIIAWVESGEVMVRPTPAERAAGEDSIGWEAPRVQR